MTVVEFGEVLHKLLGRHPPLLDGLAVEVGVEQHDGAGEGVDRVVRLEHRPPQLRVALEVALAEVEQDPLPLLRLPRQAELLQEPAQM